MMKKSLIVLAFLAAALTLVLSGCSGGTQDLEGKYIATFELNGGTLDIGTSNVSNKINYAYDPGSLLMDPSTYGNYKISRAGYIFTGWYKTQECRDGEQWDFSKDAINSEKVTLYAGWIKAIVYTYSVCYVDGTDTTTLGTYNVQAGAAFEDYRNHAGKRDNHTAVGYFSDPACTIPWDFTTVHPGGETDTDIPVYVSYIEGDWILVNSYSKLISSVGKGNIYLTADIDCEGQELFFRGSFTQVFEGNGYTVKNFKVEKFGSRLMPSVAIFQTLGAGAEIRNVSFENATYRFMDVENANKIKVGALAIDARECKVTNVTVSGVFQTNTEKDVSGISNAFYEEGDAVNVTGFTSTVTVEKQ